MRDGGLPEAGTVLAREREVQDELAGLRFPPARPREETTWATPAASGCSPGARWTWVPAG